MDDAQIGQALELLASKMVWAGIAIVIANLIKDLLIKVAAGVAFYLDPEFSVGDAVYIDDKPAEIVAIGIFSTKFRINADEERHARHRLVQNNRLDLVRLEKPVQEFHK